MTRFKFQRSQKTIHQELNFRQCMGTQEIQEERLFKTDAALERFQQYHSYSYREIDHSTMDIAPFAAISH